LCSGETFTTGERRQRVEGSFPQEIQQVFKAGRKMEEPAADSCVELWCLEVI
jgi:hypothetical protein